MPKPPQGTSTITLRMVKDANGSGTPNYGDIVTFDVQTTETAHPWVTLRCFQNGVLLAQESNRMDLGVQGEFTLGPSPLWQSGAADGVASLESWDTYSKNRKVSEITTLNFAIGA